MTIDHTGFFLFPHNIIFRIIGRLAYPIFAAMIAEVCRFTRNRCRYCLVMLAIACVCSAAAYIAEGSLHQTIFTTFSCAIMLIFALDNVVKGHGQTRGIIWGLTDVTLTLLYFSLFHLGMIPGLETDYGFFGIMTQVLVRCGRNKVQSLALLAHGLCLISAELGAIQLFSLVSVMIFWFYNGKRGKYGMKWFFSGYYPLHVAVLYGISQLIS